MFCDGLLTPIFNVLFCKTLTLALFMLMFNAMGKGRAFHTSCNSYFMFCVVAKYILQFAEINLNLVVSN